MIKNILVVDDHTLMAEMTSSFLEKEEDFSAAFTNTMDDAIQRINANGGFDIVLLDYFMPGMNGLEGVSKFIAANKAGAVVIFSGQTSTEAALRAIEIGAKGYIPKSASLRSMVNAVRFISMGETYLPQTIAPNIGPTGRSKKSDLLPIEIEVVKAIRRGQTNKCIAREIGISEDRVKMHVRSICSKMNVRNRTQVAMHSAALKIE